VVVTYSAASQTAPVRFPFNNFFWEKIVKYILYDVLNNFIETLFVDFKLLQVNSWSCGEHI